MEQIKAKPWPQPHLPIPIYMPFALSSRTLRFTLGADASWGSGRCATGFRIGLVGLLVMNCERLVSKFPTRSWLGDEESHPSSVRGYSRC